MTQNNFLRTITICLALLANTIFAGIYQVVVLQSPDKSQQVRIYFDSHALGTIQQNEQQFDIINQSIQQFSSTGKHLEILVETPPFFHPLESDWVYVLREEEQPQDIQAITHKTLQTELAKKQIKKFQELPKYQSSLFFPIPYLIGQNIKPENPQYKNIRLTSIDPRMLPLNLETFTNGGTVPESLKNLSLNNIFTQMIKQTRTTHKTIDYMHAPPSPEQEIAATTHQAATRGTLTRSAPALLEINSQKIDREYALLEKELTDFIHTFKTELDELSTDAWNQVLVPYATFEMLFNRAEQAIIKKNITASNFIKWLEYYLLQHIIEPGSAKEIAIFVGGIHANNMINILTQLDYTLLYKNGYERDFVNRYFETIISKELSPYDAAQFYPPTAITRINRAITETLATDAIPFVNEINILFTVTLAPTNLSDAVRNYQWAEVKNILMQPKTNPLDVNSSMGSKQILTLLQFAILKMQTIATIDERTNAIKTIETLLLFGANPNLRNNFNKDAFYYAYDPEVKNLLHTLDINKEYLDLPESQYYIELEKLSLNIKPLLERALLALKENRDPKGLLKVGLIRLSKIHYLTQKSAPDNDTKTILLGNLNELEKLCEEIQAMPQYQADDAAMHDPNLKEYVDNFVEKIEIMKPKFEPHKERP